MECTYKVHGKCKLAESISGVSCPIKTWICDACQAKATEENITDPVVTLARHSAFLQGKSELSAELAKRYSHLFEVQADAPAKSLCKHLGTPQREAMCSGCGGGKVAQVFMCNLLGRECTLTPSDGTQDGEPVEFCSTCELWEEEE